VRAYQSQATAAVLERRAITFRQRGLEAMERYQTCHLAKDEAMRAAWSKIASGFYGASAIMAATARRKRCHP
jgi:hypothetical protein